MSAARETLSASQAACDLAANYVPVFPCKPTKRPYTTHGFVDATTDLDVIERWWTRWPDALIGVPTGQASGLLVIDIDPAGEGWYREHFDRLACARIHQTRRGHHLLYKMPDDDIRSSAGKVAPGIDVRATGGYIIWWPAHGLEAVGDLGDLTDPPQWLLEELKALERPQDPRTGAPDADGGIARGARNATLASLAGSMRRRGMAAEEILPALLAVNRARCVPPLPDTEVRRIAESVARYAPDSPAVGAAVRAPLVDLDSPSAPDLSHDDLALRWSRAGGFEQRARYVAAWGRWMLWQGTHWAHDERLAHMTDARQFLRDLAADIERWAARRAQQAETPEAGEKLIQWASGQAKTLRQAPTRANVEQTARSNAELSASADQWDADRLLLGTPGGTVDLRTGELREARREDYITKQVAVAPAPVGTPAPLWTAFLQRIFAGDAELIGFMQRLAGYALTGMTTEQKLFFLYGGGANGKSVFLDTLLGLLADYATRAPAAMFIDQQNDRHPTELAGLRGARLVVSSELPPGKAWNETVLKDATGGDTITARFMRGDFFTYAPQFSLIIAGNHQPSLRSVDEAMRRRVVLVPFNVTIPPHERDLGLAEKLRAEWPAILRWAIDGAVEWQRTGLAVPESVQAASGQYLDSEDLLGEFIDECLKPTPDGFVPMREGYAAFRDWCHERGIRSPWSQHALTRAMRERGLMLHRRNQGMGVLGYTLAVANRAHGAEVYRTWTRGE